jgi:hypothetical protein
MEINTNIASSKAGFNNVELLDTKNLGKTKKYPHMIDSNPRDMVGTFKFSK